jgi:phage minor structural protein
VANLINLFKKDETNFETNGIGSLDNNILNPEISWKDNGAFTLEFRYPLFAKHGFEIENSSIIRANDPEGSNLFFVYKITPSMGYVTVLCYQISYKLAFNSINDTNIVNKNGQNALTQMSSSTQYPHSFKFNSDISTTATSRVVRKNPIEFLLDPGLDNSFVNRWGGHIVRHNFNIAMNSAYGSNKGYTIRHKKDLKGYEAEFDESTVITRIRPIGYDGLLLPEIYVDSSLIDSYTEPRIQEIEYSNVKVKTKDSDEEGFSTKELAYAELRRLANLEFSKNKVDQPDFSAKVEFVNLNDTQEYEDLKSLKQILAGDTVKVIHEEDNFSIEAQMVEYKWNPLNQSYISITLGNYTKTFTSTVSKASNLQTNLSQIAQQAQSAMTSASGKNTVYSLTYKPSITKSSTEGDLLYLKNGDKTELWILEKVNGKLQWVLQVSDATQEELKAQMAQAKTDIDEAVNSANAAVDKANVAVDKANENVTAIQANTQLITDVNTVANNAKTQAQTAVTNANTAKTQAQTALDKADGVSSKVTTIETNIDSINGTLSSKANTTDLNALKGRVSTAESSITQNAGQIKLKANQADVNKITDKVNAVESSITVQSGQITALNTKTDGQTTQIGKLESSYSGFESTIASVKSDLDNMVIGGTNILATTTEDKTFRGNGAENQFAILSQLTKNSLADYGLKVGDKVSFSCTCEISGSGFSGIFTPRLRTAWVNLTQDYKAYVITKAEKIYFKSTFVVTESRLANGTGVDFRADNVPDSVIMKWSNLKLEIGDKATYYSPAPEEKASQIQVTQMAQDLDGFKTTVSNTYLSKSDAGGTYADKVSVASQITQSATAVTSNVQSWTNNKLTAYSTTLQTDSSITNAVASKADKSQITQLSNQITSTVTGSTNETLISTQMISSTTLKHPNFPNMPMVEVPVVNGESYTVSSNHPWENNAAHVFYIRATTTQPLTATNGIYDGKSITLPAMSDKIYIVFRTQAIADIFIGGKYWVKVTKTPASQSQITQLATDINLRVSKGDVTSQINIEAGRTLIDTKQLLLNADTVKFSGSAFIPNAMIQNLSAEKITAGTLNAANVNVINLNARALTAGTISGTNLSMNLDTGAVQFQKGYIAGSNSKIRFDLDNSYLHSLNSGGSGFKISDGQLSFFDGLLGSTPQYLGAIMLDAFSSDFSGIKVYGSKGASIQGGGNAITVGYSLFRNDKIGISGNTGVTGNLSVSGNLSVTGSKNAVHVTRDGVRATPAYETAESYLGDIGCNYTGEDCEVWVNIEKLFSDTVNTDIAYHVFLQAYDNARFWVEDFKPDKFLIKSDKPMARFAWELKAKRRGYENERLVLQEGFDNKMLLDAHAEGAF